MTEQLNQKERAALLDMVRGVSHVQDPDLVLNLIWEASRLFGKHPVRDVEDALRNLGSPIYLIAGKAKIYGEISPVLPHTEEKPYTHFLSVCLNGKDEAYQLA